VSESGPARPEVEERTSFASQLLQEWIPVGLPLGPVPDATPADGPDPYGNPDPEWLRVDWREHLRTIELPTPRDARELNGRPSGSRVNYVDLGAGSPAIVFVHGLSGSWQNWLENLPHFSKAHRVVALDLPGFGDSELPPWEITVESYGRLLVEFCDALEIDDCVVVGNSLGGFIAAEAAIREPRRFEKLVLVSAAGISHARMRRQPAETSARMAAAMTPLVMKLQERSFLRPRLRNSIFLNIFHRPRSLRRELLWEQWVHGAAPPGFLPAVRGLVGYDFTDRLEEIQVPTLIVWGRNDRIVPPNDAFGWIKHLPEAELEVFDRTGHLPQLERPVRFNRLLEGFLSR
jgi:pimeloyl-ACP methyl ester carboxylesterase